MNNEKTAMESEAEHEVVRLRKVLAEVRADNAALRAELAQCRKLSAEYIDRTDPTFQRAEAELDELEQLRAEVAALQERFDQATLAYGRDVVSLTKQRDEAREISKKYEDRYFSAAKDRDEALAEVSALREDKERLEFMFRRCRENPDIYFHWEDREGVDELRAALAGKEQT